MKGLALQDMIFRLQFLVHESEFLGNDQVWGSQMFLLL